MSFIIVKYIQQKKNIIVKYIMSIYNKIYTL